MIISFEDRENLDNTLNGSSFENPESLIKFLHSLSLEHPFFCELVGENGYNLLLGLGNVWSCIQYSRADGDPPYLMALHDENSEDGSDLEFLIGGTTTPVPYRFRLSWRQLEEIVRYFSETGKYSPAVRWEEI